MNHSVTTSPYESENSLDTESLNSISLIILNYAKYLKESACNSLTQALPSQTIKEKEDLNQ